MSKKAASAVDSLRVTRRGAAGYEVAREAIADLPRCAALLQVDVAQLVEGVEHLLGGAGPLSWADYRQVMENIGRLADSDEVLLAVGRIALEVEETAALVRAVGLFVNPTQFILSSGTLARRFFSNVRIKVSALPDGRVEYDMWIGDEYEPCRAFFVVIAGAIGALPTAVGMDTAHVEYEVAGRKGRYLIRPPCSRTIWARMWSTIRVILNTQEAVRQLHEGQIELESRERFLESAIKERSRALDERSRALTAKKQALAARDRFLQTMGHELRTPFNGLLHTTQALREPQPYDDPDELLSALTESSFRLCGLLDSVLTYAKLSSGDVSWQPSAHKLKDLAEAICASAWTDFESGVSAESPLVLDRSVETVFGTDPESWWSMDLVQLVRVGRELVVNALNHTAANTVVQLEVAIVDGQLGMRVRDFGEGMDEADLEKVFEPFEQLVTGEVRTAQGSGLGLSIVRATLHGVGGDIQLRNASTGSGIEAWVTMSLDPAEPPTVTAHGRRVLVVDDDRTNRMVAKRILRALDCTVDTAKDGQEALDKLEREPFDLVLMDCEMPNLDGWATTRRLRSLGNTIPVVAATAYASEADRIRCREVGMNDFLAKPIAPRVLASTLDKWLGPA